ncbi:MAG: hypothetical protein IPK19_14785 [Chloroflexi bacterium]|nr:hypothetical protein [Chloroflexota bacterium]
MSRVLAVRIRDDRLDDADLRVSVLRVIEGFLEREQEEVYRYLHPQSLMDRQGPGSFQLHVAGSALCDAVGSDSLAFANVVMAVDSLPIIGLLPFGAVVLNDSGRWKVLSFSTAGVVPATSDVSVDGFLVEAQGDDPGEAPVSPILLEPVSGFAFTQEDLGRSGLDFVWMQGHSDSVIGEVIEFVNTSEQRSFLFLYQDRGGERRVERNMLPSNAGEWIWRVWSIGSDGRVSFSYTRRFTQ